MILPIYPNYIHLSSLSIISVNLGKNWEKLENDLIFRDKLKFESDIISKNRGSIHFHIFYLNIVGEVLRGVI